MGMGMKDRTGKPLENRIDYKINGEALAVAMDLLLDEIPARFYSTIKRVESILSNAERINPEVPAPVAPTTPDTKASN
jgi:hypothetical protein